MKESIAIDMDGVMANVEKHFVDWYNKNHGENFSVQDIQGKSEADAFPKSGIIKKYASTPGFFSTVPVMEDAIEAIKKLNDHYEVYIVSAAMEFPQSLIEKREWLQEHFPFISWKQIVFCGSKNVIKADYMIDDHPKNLDPFSGTSILFEAFHNLDVNAHYRVKNWKEVLTYFNV